MNGLQNTIDLTLLIFNDAPIEKKAEAVRIAVEAYKILHLYNRVRTIYDHTLDILQRADPALRFITTDNTRIDARTVVM